MNQIMIEKKSVAFCSGGSSHRLEVQTMHDGEATINASLYIVSDEEAIGTFHFKSVEALEKFLKDLVDAARL